MKRLGRWAKSHSKQLIYALLALVVLTATAGVSYKAGQRQPATLAKTKAPLTAFSKDTLKNLQKKSTSPSTTPTNPLTTSSGFFRLSGTIQAVGKDSISVKLTNGSVIVLATKSTTNYYDGKTKRAIKDLAKNTKVMTTGSIGADGTFTVSAVQKSK